jgi:MscS family membrane protein
MEEFWETVVEVWQHGLMGVDVGSIIAALLIMAAFLLLRGAISKYVLTKLEQYADRSTTRLDDRIVHALIPPVRFIPVVLGMFFAGQFLELPGDLGFFWGRVIRSLIAFTIFWAIYNAMDPLSRGLHTLERLLTPTMVHWMFRALKIIVALIGGAVILELWGIEVGPILAGLGLFGAAVALGAQEFFKNVIAGFSIIAEKRFGPGENISVKDIVDGRVEDIGFRSTYIIRLDGTPVSVPNVLLSDVAVFNLSRITNRRIRWTIGVNYATTAAQLKTIRDEILSYIEKQDIFGKTEELSPTVRVDALGTSSIDFLVQCFTTTGSWDEWMKAKEDLALAIKEIVEEKAKAAFAFPSQSVYVESLPDVIAEGLKASNDEKAA